MIVTKLYIKYQFTKDGNECLEIFGYYLLGLVYNNLIFLGLYDY